jgi:hypothetical protein
MITIIWTLPIPSTNIGSEPCIREIRYRDHDLKFSLIDEDGKEYEYLIRFEGVEAYKCIYLTSCSVEIIKTAYDKLIDCGRTDWLIESEEISERVGNLRKELHHYRIFFDEGPCYEFICEKALVCPPEK